jgi:hypothetical protein
MYRLASFIVVGMVVAAALAVYAEQPADPGEEPPALLKKKGAPEIQDPPAPPAEDKDKDKKPADAPKPDADKGEADQPRPDPDEVLKSVAKSMHTAEERLANKELGEGTRQAQEDALKGLDSLIDLAANPPDDKNDQDSSSDSSSSKSDSSKSQKSDSSKSSASQSRSSSSSSSSSSPSSKMGKGRRGSRTGKNKSGMQPGAGTTSSGQKQQGDQPQDAASNHQSNQGDIRGSNDPQMAKDPNADLYKSIWGHLPETLRAEMNAYSNTKGFMPEYEALISRYYSTIAEQGRRKGD